jgi:hypothetical protein
MSRLSFCFRTSIFGYQNSLIQPYDGQVRPEIVFGIGTPITCSNPFLSTFRTLQKHWGNTQKFGACPFSSLTLVFPGVFRISGEVPLAVCSAHAGSVHGGMRRCISRRAAQIESSFESHETKKARKSGKSAHFRAPSPQHLETHPSTNNFFAPAALAKSSSVT